MVVHLFSFFSLDDETSDEFSGSDTEVEMKVAKPRKRAAPVSFTFSINVDIFPFI